MTINNNEGYIMLMTLTALMIISISSIYVIDDIHTHQQLLEEMITYAFH